MGQQIQVDRVNYNGARARDSANEGILSPLG